MMNCVIFDGAGGPEVVKYVQRPVPKVMAKTEVLIEVAAAGINYPDVMQRKGLYAPPPGASDIPGLELSGTIKEVGLDVTKFQPGDKVCALVTGGGYAEYVVAEQDNVILVPQGLSLVESGALLETFMTVWSHLFKFAKFSAGKSILIHGGTSGIGTAATMLTRAFGASEIYTTVSTEENQRASEALGATAAINYKEKDFVAEVKRLTDGKGVDYVLDIIAGSYVQKNYEVAAMLGTIVQVGVMQGEAERVNLGPMLAKRLTHLGITLRSQTTEAKAQILNELQEKVWPLVAKGELKPLIFQTFSLQDAGAAHERMDKGKHVGKFVLVVKKDVK